MSIPILLGKKGTRVDWGGFKAQALAVIGRVPKIHSVYSREVNEALSAEEWHKMGFVEAAKAFGFREKSGDVSDDYGLPADY